MMGLPDYKQITYGDLETEVYTKMISQIDQPDALTLVDFFEASKTISSLVDIVRQFRSILVRIAKSQEMKEWMRKHGIPSRYPTPGETFQFISENWLRYRYMVLPLFLSGQGVLKAYKSTPPPKGSRATYRASGSLTDHDTIYGAYVTSSSWKSRIVAERTVTVRVRCGALTEVVRAKCLEASLGLDAQSLPRSIWEAIPWSFVWDWFFNIGDFIAAVSPHVGRKTLGSWTTTTITSEITWRTENSHTFSGSVWNVSLSNSSGYRSKTWTIRDAGGNVGLINRPFKARFTDLIHLYDAIALLSKRFT
nr:MAG: maturation protein [Sanya solspi-like virus 1]